MSGLLDSFNAQKYLFIMCYTIIYCIKFVNLCLKPQNHPRKPLSLKYL